MLTGEKKGSVVHGVQEAYKVSGEERISEAVSGRAGCVSDTSKKRKSRGRR